MSLDISKGIIDDIKNPFSIDSHLYSTNYDLVKSTYNVRNEFDSTYDDINFDVCKLFFNSDVFEGTYKVCFNFLYNIFGDMIRAAMTPRARKASRQGGGRGGVRYR